MPLGLWPVLEIGARVQDLVVVQQLDVPWTEIHREWKRGVVARVFEEVHGRDLAAREPPRLGEKLLRRFDVLANIDTGEFIDVPMVDRDVEPGLHALGYFAPPVGGKRLEQRRQEVRAPGEHLVVERHGTREVALAARFRRL